MIWNASRGSCCSGRRWPGSIFGLIGFGELAEDYLRVARNSFHEHKASGDIVVVDNRRHFPSADRQLALAAAL